MAGDETWDEGTDLLSRAVLLVLGGLLLAASRLLSLLPLPRGRRGPSYCQARTSCVQATHGCACTPDDGGKP